MIRNGRLFVSAAATAGAEERAGGGDAHAQSQARRFVTTNGDVTVRNHFLTTSHSGSSSPPREAKAGCVTHDDLVLFFAKPASAVVGGQLAVEKDRHSNGNSKANAMAARLWRISVNLV